MTTTDALIEQIMQALQRVEPDARPCNRRRAAAVLPIIRAAQADAWDEGSDAFEAAHKWDNIEPWGHLIDNPYRTTEKEAPDA